MEYLSWRIHNKKLQHIKWFDVLRVALPEEKYDLILCNDVLEHLENSSETLKGLYKALKANGKLIIQAPWGGMKEHIPEAADDFYNNGGMIF